MIGWSNTLLNQVSKLKHVRNLSLTWTCHERKVCELRSRAVVRVQGSESMDFLQGLMTNDMEHLEHQSSLYSMFLNTQGRIMFDTFVVKRNATEYLIDCDHHLAENLVKHLKMFKVRRKINISLQEDEKVWAILGDELDENKLLKSAVCYNDNRCKALGFRAIGENLEMDSEKFDMDDYQTLRYQQGIPEGSLEIPPGKCTPLEYNIEYMHGVSFHKGCYIGQELTARTHHTGVIRKRIMPLTLSASSKTSSTMMEENKAQVLNEKGKKVGVVRGQCRNTAIGLLRLDQVMNNEKLNINGELVQIHIPEWWPKAAPKSPQNR